MLFQYFSHLLAKKQVFADISTNIHAADFSDDHFVSAKCDGSYPDKVIKNGPIVEFKDLMSGGDSIAFNSEMPRAKMAIKDLPKNILEQMKKNNDLDILDRDVFYLLRKVLRRKKTVKVILANGEYYDPGELLIAEEYLKKKQITSNIPRNVFVASEDFGPISVRARFMFAPSNKNKIFTLVDDNTINLLFVCKTDEELATKQEQVKSYFWDLLSFQVKPHPVKDAKCLIFSTKLDELDK